MSKETMVDFKCKNCGGVITLGIVGGLESLEGDMPPCCLYCGSTEPLEATEKAQS